MKLIGRIVSAACVGGVFVLLFAGCASRAYKVRVNSIAQAKPTSGISYRIRNRNPAVDDQGLRYAEAVRHIKTALSAQGMYEAPNSQSADMIVELDYGIEPPRVKHTIYNVPIFGNTANPAPSGLAESLDASNKDIVGYQPEISSVTVREKRLSVRAHENRSSSPERPPAEFWRVDVSIDDKSHDLRGYLPVLASAAMDYIGQNTSGEESMVVPANGDAVRFVQKGL